MIDHTQKNVEQMVAQYVYARTDFQMVSVCQTKKLLARPVSLADCVCVVYRVIRYQNEECFV